MPLSSLHNLEPLTDISAISAAVMASPAIRKLLNPVMSNPAEIPANITCGEIIVAIFDLLEGTAFAPHAAEIVEVILTRSAHLARHRTSAH